MNWRKLIVPALALTVILMVLALSGITTSGAISIASASDKLCQYHGVAVDLCTRCDSALIPAFKAKGDWCAEHNLPESQCDICNPNLKSGAAGSAESGHDHSAHGEDAHADAAHGEAGHDHSAHASTEESEHDHSKHETTAVDWCPEHRVPESQCTKCHPELIADFKAKGDWCGGHDVPESHCYQCNSGLKFEQEAEYKKQQPDQKQSHVPNTSLKRPNASDCATDHAIIQFASINTAERIGISIVTTEESPSAAALDVPGEVEFDATQSMAVTCPVSGVLMRWVVNPGAEVKRGQILAYIESIEAAERMADYVHASALHNLAAKSFDRKRQLAQKGLESERDADEAEADYLQTQADVNRAATVLRMLGYTDENLAELRSDTDNSRLIPLRARQSGKLVEQTVKLGTILDAGQPIGMISETAQLWVEAQVPESGMDRVQIGQTATVSLDGNGWTSGAGQVIWVADGVDENTRMGKVRIAIEPNGNTLRAHQFVRVNIETSAVGNTVLIPVDAVQWEGCCNVVFVQDTPDRFKPRKIKIDHTVGKFYAVSGVQPGEKIVGKGSYLLKTELMKSSIGAGCCGEGA